ncbi:pentapeptide repeat-containing protein [Acaryochloris sp. IP29b_bin.148]|nr:pentapeptide repeat-containing protein [Acaryochloris sp. IP29b_bin.148]
MTAEELLERYAAGERDFRQSKLEYADLSGFTLRGCDFTESHLEN